MSKPNPAAMRERCRRFDEGSDTTIVLVPPASEWADPVQMEGVRKGLAAATMALHGCGRQALYCLREGEPEHEIAALANELSADLVLLPAH